MPTQDVPAFLINKLAGFALLILGGLFAVYGLNYGETIATVVGCVLAAVGILILVLKILRRNHGPL